MKLGLSGCRVRSHCMGPNVFHMEALQPYSRFSYVQGTAQTIPSSKQRKTRLRQQKQSSQASSSKQLGLQAWCSANPSLPGTIGTPKKTLRLSKTRRCRRFPTEHFRKTEQTQTTQTASPQHHFRDLYEVWRLGRAGPHVACRMCRMPLLAGVRPTDAHTDGKAGQGSEREPQNSVLP